MDPQHRTDTRTRADSTVRAGAVSRSSDQRSVPPRAVRIAFRCAQLSHHCTSRYSCLRHHHHSRLAVPLGCRRLPWAAGYGMRCKLVSANVPAWHPARPSLGYYLVLGTTTVSGFVCSSSLAASRRQLDLTSMRPASFCTEDFLPLGTSISCQWHTVFARGY